jgi:hypothetical protein
MRHLLTRQLIAFAFALGLTLTLTLPALACGALIAPDGDVHLSKATNLVAWHNGVEHYLASFTYEGTESNVGYIVPLPSLPTSIVAGGQWTLQRLEREVAPPLPAGVFAAAAASNSGATVVEQTQVEALSIKVVKGNGDAIIAWAQQNGYFLSPEVAAHLKIYANGSPYFLAARYDTSQAKARGQIVGDGVPVLITMPTPRLWVPIEVLASENQPITADIFLLTDKPVNTSEFGAMVGQSPVNTQVPGATGMRVAFQEHMTPSLYHDLSTDRNMGWIPADSWLTYLSLNATEQQVGYDISLNSDDVVTVAPFGTPLASVAASVKPLPGWLPRLPIGAPEVILWGLVIAALGAVTLWVLLSRRRIQKRAA